MNCPEDRQPTRRRWPPPGAVPQAGGQARAPVHGDRPTACPASASKPLSA